MDLITSSLSPLILFIYLFFSVFFLKYELIDTFHIQYTFIFFSVSFSLYLSVCVSHPIYAYDQQELVIILKTISPGWKSVHFGEREKNETNQIKSNRARTHSEHVKNSRQSAKR